MLFSMRWLLKTRSLQVFTCQSCGGTRSLACHASQTTSRYSSSSSYPRLVSDKNFLYNQFKRVASTTSSATIGVPTITRQEHNVSSKLQRRYHRKQDIMDNHINTSNTVNQVSHHLGIMQGKLMDILEEMGQEVDSFDSAVSPELVELLCMEFNKTPLNKTTTTATSNEKRPPVVTIMGHVDHGKTTLLDALRNSSIAAGEAGGITQHIGAFIVKLPSGEQITFIDTPGHAAFETMRARGANVTDVVVLVVAADDGVMTQTVESFRHAIHANVPVVVAINKIDKGKKNVDRLKHQMLSHGIQLEEYGGEVQAVEISALKGINLESLTDAIIALAEVNDLKANSDANVQGVVIESKKDKGLGPVATALVQNGTLNKGDIIVAGSAFAKVRQLYSDNGIIIDRAPPSTPVQVTGWRELPTAGEKLFQVETERRANEIVSLRKANETMRRRATLFKGFSVDGLEKEEGGRIKTAKGKYDATNKVDIVIKGDVDGSVEAIVDAIKTYKSDKMKLSVLHAGVGSVSENDVKIAHLFEGVVFGFNIKISKDMQQLANQLNVQIKNHRVIYKLLQDLKNEMSSRLPAVKQEKPVGEAEILKVFKLTGSKKACVAGCRVRQGIINKDSNYRVLRGDKAIFEGKLSSLKRGADNVSLVKKEQECGISFDNFSAFKEGDRIECFEVTMVSDEVDWNWGF